MSSLPWSPCRTIRAAGVDPDKRHVIVAALFVQLGMQVLKGSFPVRRIGDRRSVPAQPLIEFRGFGENTVESIAGQNELRVRPEVILKTSPLASQNAVRHYGRHVALAGEVRLAARMAGTSK
jgi:hypothetical protein